MGGSVAEWLACWTQAQKGPGSNHNVHLKVKVKVAHTRVPAGDVSHKPDSRLPLLSARPAVTPATLKRAATNFSAW